MLLHLLPVVAACALNQASTPRTVLTRRGALLGAGAPYLAAVAAPMPVLASSAVEDKAVGEVMRSIDGMRVEVAERFAAGPLKTVMVTGASTEVGFDAASCSV